MTDSLRHNASLVESLGAALRSGEHGLGTVPGLLKRLLSEGAWREFTTKRGEPAVHERFEDFVTTPPLKGLGATVELIDRIVGTDDPELLLLLKTARKGKPGPRTGEFLDESSKNRQDHTADDLERLAREAPDEYEAVRQGEKTIHRAAVDAGIRRRRIPVRLDSAESAARTLRKHMPADVLAQLVDLLREAGE